MLVQLSLLGDLYPGTIRGTTIQNSNGGMQLHSKAQPANRRVPKQQQHRQQFRLSTATYRSLSPTDIAAWEASEFGGLSGFNLYMSTNQLLQTAGLPFTSSPPTFTEPPNTLISDPVAGILDVEFACTISPADVPAGCILFFNLTPWYSFAQPLSAARFVRYPVVDYGWASGSFSMPWASNEMPGATPTNYYAYGSLLVVDTASGLQALSNTLLLEYPPL